MFESTKVPILGVVESMSSFICDSCTKEHFIFGKGGGSKLASQLGVPLVGRIPMNASLAQASDKGDPFVLAHPNSDISRTYNELAQSVAAQISILAHGTNEGIQSYRLEWQR